MIKMPGNIRVTRKPNTKPDGWSTCDVILPDGSTVLGFEHPQRAFFYFESGVWWRGRVNAGYYVGRRATIETYDLRDQKSLEAFDKKLDGYETTILTGTAEEIDAASDAIEAEATRLGYNNHRRLAALHTLAEGVGA